MKNLTKLCLTALFAKMSIYICTIYYYSTIKKNFNLKYDFILLLLSINSVGVVGNLFFSYISGKFRTHKSNIMLLIIVQSVAFISIKLSYLCFIKMRKKSVTVIISVLNAISNGGFNPLFSSYALNFFTKSKNMNNYNKIRQFSTLGNASAGFIALTVGKIYKNEENIVFLTSSLSAGLAVFFMYNVDHEFYIEHSGNDKYSFKDIIKYHFKKLFALFYSVNIFQGIIKMTFATIQRNFFESLKISSEQTTQIKFIGCVFELLMYPFYMIIEGKIGYNIFFPIAVCINALKLGLLCYLKLEVLSNRILFIILVLLEAMDRISLMAYSNSSNKILATISPSETITFSQGLQFATFISLGSLISGVFGSQIVEKSETISAEDFRVFLRKFMYLFIPSIYLSFWLKRLL